MQQSPKIECYLLVCTPDVANQGRCKGRGPQIPLSPHGYAMCQNPRKCMVSLSFPFQPGYPQKPPMFRQAPCEAWTLAMPATNMTHPMKVIHVLYSFGGDPRSRRNASTCTCASAPHRNGVSAAGFGKSFVFCLGLGGLRKLRKMFALSLTDQVP